MLDNQESLWYFRNMKFEPMLATAIEDTGSLQYPVYASPKLDGVRAMVQGGKLVSRKLKLIPNVNVQAKFAGLPDGLDGELIVGDALDPQVFSNTTSVVMSHNKPADNVIFYVFDYFQSEPFQTRLTYLREWFNENQPDDLTLVHQALVKDEESLLSAEEVFLQYGFEGLMVRSIDGPYKQDRSTIREGWLLKLKRFKDGEAKIVGFEEEQKNTNVATKDALGHTERSSAKAGLVGKGTLGKFEVIGINDPYTGVEFSVGGGLTAKQRREFWGDRQKLVGKILKYKYFPKGSVERPRFPVFLGFRDKRDM